MVVLVIVANVRRGMSMTKLSRRNINRESRSAAKAHQWLFRYHSLHHQWIGHTQRRQKPMRNQLGGDMEESKHFDEQQWTE